MDLEAIWQTHKQFITKVISGALVFLVFMWGRSALADAEASMARKNASQELAFVNKKTELHGAEGSVSMQDEIAKLEEQGRINAEWAERARGWNVH